MISRPFVLALIFLPFLYSGPANGILIGFIAIIRQDDLDRSLAVRTSATAILVFIFFQLLRLIWASWRATKTRQWEGPGRILIFLGRVSHTRFFPKQHSFSGRYLMVGVPVGFEGNAGGMVSVGTDSKTGLSSWFSFASHLPKGWFHVDPADYLRRGKAGLGLRGKLDDYLQAQGVDPATFPHAYLVTAPRFLGYQFNPASFWYLYDADKCLAAMLVEVNNTFGERRIYYVLPENDAEGQITDGKKQYQNTRTVFKQSWPKDFHVSPFSSRKGSYSLTTTDPLAPSMAGSRPLSVAINLLSSKGYVKLSSMLTSGGNPIDPYKMTVLDKLTFLTWWWWVGLATVPRILKEAAELFYCHGLHVWWRPEPLKGTIARTASSTERQLEPVFRRYLRHLVEQSPTPLAVNYVASGISENTEELMLSPRAKTKAEVSQELEIRVLTPIFYSRFVYYAHDLEAFFCEINESCTVWVSRPDLLPKLLLKKPTITLESSGLRQYACFKLIQRFRVRPKRIERPMTSSRVKAANPRAAAVDIRKFFISSMDAYVMENEPASAQAAYRSSVLKLFIADRIALGSVQLLEAQLFIIQVVVAWLFCSAMKTRSI